MKVMTLCFPIKDNPSQHVLLGLKKVGFGQGKYSGFGGKVEAGETVEMGAVRELAEEVGLKTSVEALQKMGQVTFLFPAKPTWHQVVHIFLLESWVGNPTESDEMTPAWFRVSKIPFDRMWQDAVHWLPHILAGKRIRASFIFEADNETIADLKIETQ